jgi:hypothetical protein
MIRTNPDRGDLESIHRLMTSETTTETSLPRSLGTVMSSEAAFEPEVNDAPLRVSGFVSLILALLSGFAIVAWPMVGVAIAAVFFGLFALRKSDSASKPVGTTPARIGILLAVFFAAWGVGRPLFKMQTLGSQAEYFARQFVEVASRGNEAYAAELRKSYVNRYLKSMPLEERYELEKQKRLEAAQNGEGGSPPVDVYPDSLSQYPPDHEWILDRPVRVYSHYGRQKADVILAADRSEKPFRLLVTLEYLVHKERDTGEWYVENVTPYRKRIVAESVL